MIFFSKSPGGGGGTKIRYWAMLIPSPAGYGPAAIVLKTAVRRKQFKPYLRLFKKKIILPRIYTFEYQK